MNQNLIRQVWQRAQGRCEYCHVPASVYPLPFHIDHVVARQHGGPTVLDNLALACLQLIVIKGLTLLDEIQRVLPVSVRKQCEDLS